MNTARQLADYTGHRMPSLLNAESNLRHYVREAFRARNDSSFEQRYGRSRTWTRNYVREMAAELRHVREVIEAHAPA